MTPERKWFLAAPAILLAYLVLLQTPAPAVGQAKKDGGPQTELWARQTLLDKSDETGEAEIGFGAKAPLEAALEDARKRSDRPLMSGGIPVVTNGHVFYRTYAGLTAVYLHDQRDKTGDVTAKAGSILWRSTPFWGALGRIFEAPSNVYPLLKNWIPRYDQLGLSNILFENSTVGTLSADSHMVYAIDDLALPIPPEYLPPATLWGNHSYVSDELRKLVMQNQLRAHEVASGKFAWELGGISDNTGEFKNSHFLGAPIPVGGKLYVLNEKNNGELRLVCVEAHKVPVTNAQRRQEWVVNIIPPIQKLVTVKSEFAVWRDPVRRTNAIRLVCDEGMLVCPSHAGEVFGVDVAKQEVRWNYTYRQPPAAAPGKLEIRNGWKFPAPFIHAGQLVFTAADDDHIHCLDLKSGKMLWKNKQGADLYVAAVSGDKVLVVSKTAIRALALKDGKDLWKLEIGAPSGLGVLDGSTYLVPLKAGATSKQPEIALVDVEQGRLLRTSLLAQTPGNLAVNDDVLVSQSPTALTAYARGKAK